MPLPDLPGSHVAPADFSATQLADFLASPAYRALPVPQQRAIVADLERQVAERSRLEIEATAGHPAPQGPDGVHSTQDLSAYLRSRAYRDLPSAEQRTIYQALRDRLRTS